MLCKNQKLFSRAYTVIEILVVIGILGIISTALIPTINRYLPSIELNGTTRVLSSNLREAQERAVTEQKQYLIRFYPNDSPKHYQLITINNSVENVIKNVNLGNSENLNIENTIVNNQIIFSPDGGPSSSGNITLSINLVNKIINVSPAGFIKIQ